MLVQLLALGPDARRSMLLRACDLMGGKAELGRALGYRDGAFVGQMIRGDRPVTEKTLRAMVELRQLQRLLQDDDRADVAEPTPTYLNRPDPHAAGLARLLDAISALPPARWASVRAQLDQLVQHPELRADIEAELQLLLAQPAAPLRKRNGTTG